MRAGEQADARPAVVHLDGGSGVCVSPDGWIVTAAHMLPGWPFDQPEPSRDRRHNVWLPAPPPPVRKVPESVAVRFGDVGPPLQAKVCVIRDRNQQSDVAILKVNATGLPFRPVATRAPAVEDPCYAAGYPNGNWAWTECRIKAIQVIQAKRPTGEMDSLDMTQTNHLSGGGASGGPLFNARCEVIGVCSRSSALSKSQQSLFARWEHVTGALLEAGYSPLSAVSSSEPTLIAFSAKWCGPCAQFKADFEAGIDCNGQPLQQAFRVQFCDIDQSPDLARKLGVSRVPAFVVDGQAPVYGYGGPQWLAQQLCRYQFPFTPKPPGDVQPIPRVEASPTPAPEVSAPQPPPAPTPEAKTDPQAASDAPPDPALMRVLVLVKKRGSLGSWSLLKGVALSKAERIAERKLPEMIKQYLGEKVRAEVVFQRTNPTRYDELAIAAGASESALIAVVLVGARFEGLPAKAAAFIEGKLQELAKAHGETVDVELVFERVNSDRYHSVIDALGEDEPPIGETEVTLAAAGTAAGSASGGLWAWFRRRRLGV